MPLTTIRQRHLLALVALFCCATTAHGQGYEPIIENIRLGAADQLTIDRGGPVDRAGDVNGDNLEDLLIGAGVGAVRVVFGPTNGNNGVLNGQQLDGTSGFVILNDPDDDSLVAGLGDINGDGLDDIGVASVSGTNIVFGSSSGFERTLDVADLDGTNGFAFASGATDIKRAGDINADGLADIVVGNANASPNGLEGAGVSYVIFGSNNGFPATITPEALTGSNGFAIVGISAQDRTGRYVAGAGDFNNDGFDDVLIGAPYQTTNGKAEAGAAYLLLGGSTFPSAVNLGDIAAGNGLVFEGSNIQDLVGASVSPIGDLNHDGVDDLAIGAPGKGPFGVPSDYPGEVYVLFGGASGVLATLDKDDLNGTNGLIVRGIRGGVIPIEADQAIWGDMAGADIDTAGDINGDGIDDMMIGAPHTIINPRRKGVGQLYFVYGSTSAYPARLRLSDLDGSNGFRINGTGTVDYYAVSVASAGDFNDDGRDDVVVGASGQGDSYVFYGRPTGLASVGSAPETAPGLESIGFPAAAVNLGSDVAPLSFNERADPTGPNPLPVGTPTDPLNPATPGFVAPQPLNTEPAARPGDAQEPTDGNPPGTDEPDVEPPGDNGQAPTTGGDPDNAGEGVAKTKSGGAMLWLLCLLAGVGFFRIGVPAKRNVNHRCLNAVKEL